MKISIIVPCYNIAPWLPGCLDSILQQTHGDLEVIVIDDGSTDETGNIIDRYAAIDPRIVAIHQANAGLVAVREKGIELATGDYVGFVDGDDTVAPDMFERLLNNALTYNADISHCGVAFVWPDGRVDAHYGTGRIIEQDNYTGLRDLLLGEQIEPGLWNKLYTRKIVHNSCLDTSVLNNEDMLRNFTLFSRAKKSVYEDFCGYRYFQRPGSMSKDPSKSVRTFRHIAKARRIIVDNCKTEMYPYAMRLWLSTYVNEINQNFANADPKIRALCRECKTVLKENKKNLRYLIQRQQIAAYLILYAPWLHRWIYRIYESRKRSDHN